MLFFDLFENDIFDNHLFGWSQTKQTFLVLSKIYVNLCLHLLNAFISCFFSRSLPSCFCWQHTLPGLIHPWLSGFGAGSSMDFLPCKMELLACFLAGITMPRYTLAGTAGATGWACFWSLDFCAFVLKYWAFSWRNGWGNLLLYRGQQFHSTVHFAFCKNILDVCPDGIHTEEVFFSDLSIGQTGQ